MDGGGGAYGAGKATGTFDIIAFARKPQVILRVISWLLSIVVFGCISSQGWEKDKCRYNGDPNACAFGTWIGVLAFVGLMILLAVDAMFDNISGIQHRKYAVMADIGFSGTWTFFWFVCFCYLADTWRRTENDESDWGESGVEAAIAFSLFNIGTFLALVTYVGTITVGWSNIWGDQDQYTHWPLSFWTCQSAGITALAVLRYRQGVTEQFTAGYEPDVLGVGPQSGQGGGAGGGPVPYSTYATAEQDSADPFRKTDPYQPPPFGGQDQRQPPGDFHPVTY